MLHRLDRRRGKGGRLRGAGRYWQLYLMALVPMAAVFIFRRGPPSTIMIFFIFTSSICCAQYFFKTPRRVHSFSVSMQKLILWKNDILFH